MGVQTAERLQRMWPSTPRCRERCRRQAGAGLPARNHYRLSIFFPLLLRLRAPTYGSCRVVAILPSTGSSLSHVFKQSKNLAEVEGLSREAHGQDMLGRSAIVLVA